MEFNTEQFYDNKASVTPMELVQRNLKYLPWILLSLVLSGLAAVIYLRYTPETYSASGKMIIRDDQSMNSSDDKFNRLFLSDAGTNLTNEMAVLTSTSFLQRVVEKLQLNIVYEGVGKVRSALLYEDNPLKLEVLSKKDSVSYQIDITVVDSTRFRILSGEEIKFGETFTYGQQGAFRITLTNKDIQHFETYNFKIYVYPFDIATELIVPALSVKLVTEQGNVIGVSFESMNKLQAADFVNTVMKEYRALTVEDKSIIARGTIDFIEERLDSLKAELSGVEGSLQRMQERNETLSPTEQSLLYGTAIKDIESQLTTIQSKKQILTWLSDYISNTSNQMNTVPVNLGVDEPVLAPLITGYNDLQLKRTTLLKTTTELNPMVVNLSASIDKLRQDILEALRNVGKSYGITESQVIREYNSSRRKAGGIPGQARELQNIQRQQKIKEELYLFLLSKKEEVAIGSSAVQPNASILERATIRAQLVSPIPRSVFIKFLLAGMALPIFILAIVNLLNDKIRYRSDIEKAVDIPIIGEVSRSDNVHPLQVAMGNRTYISEQFRTVRTNMSYLLPQVKTPVLLVTSTMSGEGKSFLSTNIAATFALAGKKTLIMEFDIRKPKITSNLGFKFSTGITSFLITRDSAEDLILKVKEMDNLYVFPCGAIPPNPAELMLLPRMEELFSWARANFDVIVIDSAPVGVVSDSITLGRYADATLYIVRQGYTVKKSIEFIDKLRGEKKLPNLAILLNDVNEYGSYGYGYGNKKNLEVYFNQGSGAGAGFWKRIFSKK